MSSNLRLSLAELVLLACAVGCNGARPNDTAPPSESVANVPVSVGSAPAAQPTFVAPYPRGLWRLARADVLDNTMLWFSHILVRHAGVRDEVSFSLGFWASVAPPATRTRDEALALANQLAERAAREPQGFPELAREYSEDVTSRDEGGSMGGYKASVLMLWPHVLDALAVIRPGQTSQVVETRYGFHVFYRLPPPPPDIVSGEHIVIGHAQAPWLEVFARDRAASRSREEAAAVADDLYRELTQRPERFTELVEQFSEHLDAAGGGDLGTWSRRDTGSVPARLERLGQLRIGEVGKPIETHLGFELIRRTAPHPRETFRARLLLFSFEDFTATAPNHDGGARMAAFAKAQEAAQMLLRDPSRVGEIPVQQVRQWEEGRELQVLTPLIQAIRPGQFTTEPAISEYGFVVAQRLEPVPIVPEPPQVELPTPAQADLRQMIESLSGTDARAFIREFSEEVRNELAVAPNIGEQLTALHQLDSSFDELTVDVRFARLEQVMARARLLVGEPQYTRYRATLDRAIRTLLLEASPDSPHEIGL